MLVLIILCALGGRDYSNLCGFSFFVLKLHFWLPIAAIDAVKFIDNRPNNLDSLFSVDGTLVENEDQSFLLTSLGYALEKQIRTWWDICTFEHYLKEKIIMRNLRWEVKPQNGLNDEASMTEWHNFFNVVGLKLQELVLKRKKQKIKNLEKRLWIYKLN